MKRLLALLLALTMVLSLSACSAQDSVEKDLTKTTIEYMKAIQSFQQSKMRDCTDYNSPLNDVLDLYDYNTPLMDYLTACAEKMTYKIGAVDESSLSITVECTYVDSSAFLDSYLDSLTANQVTTWQSTQHISNSISQSFIDDAVSTAGETTYTTSNITLYYYKNYDDYAILTADGPMNDVLTAGIDSSLPERAAAYHLDLSDTETVLAQNIDAEVTSTSTGLLLNLTNNNDVLVNYLTATFFFYNAKGAICGFQSNNMYTLAPGTSAYLDVSNYSNQAYARYDLYLTCSTGSYYEPYDGLTFTEKLNKDSGDITLHVTNSGTKTAENLSYIALYRKDGEVVAFSSDDAYQLEPGDSTDLTLYQPSNTLTYENVDYDTYEIELSSACYTTY